MIDTSSDIIAICFYTHVIPYEIKYFFIPDSSSEYKLALNYINNNLNNKRDFLKNWLIFKLETSASILDITDCLFKYLDKAKNIIPIYVDDTYSYVNCIKGYVVLLYSDLDCLRAKFKHKAYYVPYISNLYNEFSIYSDKLSVYYTYQNKEINKFISNPLLYDEYILEIDLKTFDLFLLFSSYDFIHIHLPSQSIGDKENE